MVFNVSIFDKYLGHLKDKPCNFIEIGTYKGESAAYLLKNWPLSELVTIDPLTPYPIAGYEDYITKDLLKDIIINLSPYTERCVLDKRRSDEAFLNIDPDSADMVFIDGDHRAATVYSDSINALRVVKPGGLIIWDDYKWTPKNIPNGEYNLDCPKWGIDFFLATNKQLKVLQKEYVVVAQK